MWSEVPSGSQCLGRTRTVHDWINYHYCVQGKLSADLKLNSRANVVSRGQKWCARPLPALLGAKAAPRILGATLHATEVARGSSLATSSCVAASVSILLCSDREVGQQPIDSGSFPGNGTRRSPELNSQVAHSAGIRRSVLLQHPATCLIRTPRSCQSHGVCTALAWS